MSDLSDKDVDISKLKVADLKKELKNRGLSTEGKKSELIDRLQVAIGDSALLDDTVADHDEILDEDVLSDDESDELHPSDTTEAKENVDTKIETKADGKVTKKIVLNRNILSITEDVMDKEAVTKSEKPTSPVATVIPKVSSLTQLEKLEQRAAKFGTPSTGEKKEARAARFGITAGDGKTGGVVSTSVDILKRRAERFGTTTAGSILDKVELEERKKKRVERFGKIENEVAKPKVNASVKMTLGQTSSDEKKKLRAQRFQLAS